MTVPVSVELKQTKPKQSNCQIFLIDDEPLVLDMHCSILQNAGYGNLHAFSLAGDAIRMLRCLRPDFILTDIHMPDVNGNVLTHLVREFQHLIEIPVIAITSDERIETAKEILEMGANAVLIKPVTPDELVGQLQFFQQPT